VITNRASYKALFDSTCGQPPIDFNSSTLLGLYASGGCEIKFIREVEKRSDGKIHYKIKVKSCGWCNSLGFSYNWVTGPKVEGPEAVTFEVEEK